MRYLLAIPTLIGAAYVAWAYGTTEGREIGRLYRSELAHYTTSHATIRRCA